MNLFRKKILKINLISTFLLCLNQTLFGGDTLKDSLPENTTQSEQKKFNGNLTTPFIMSDGSYCLDSQFRSYYAPKNRFNLFSNLTDLYYGGSIKTDYYGARRADTLRKDFIDDSFDQFRNRNEFSLAFSHKVDEYRVRPVAQGQITIGNTTFGRAINKVKNLDKELELNKYDAIFPPVKINLLEAWMQVNIDQLFSNNEPFAMSAKIGFFPFFVGRGISLGDWYNGGSNLFGFAKTGVFRHSPKYAPGFLFSGELIKKTLHYDFYYSPAVTEEVYLASTGYLATTQEEPLSERHIFAGRLKYAVDFYDNSKSYFEPYFVYYNSPRQSIFTNYDAHLKNLTLGFMVDHKAKGFEINGEFARQFGRLSVREKLNTFRPDIVKFVGTNTSGAKAYDAPISPNFLRPFSGVVGTETICDKDGVAYAQGASATTNAYYALPRNLNEWREEGSFLPENQRFFEHHPSYDVELAGAMATIDMRYTFDEYPFKVAASFGYFSGDRYLNDAVDNFVASPSLSRPLKNQPTRSAKNFLPLRDFYYRGLWALPMIMFNSGRVPRPYDLSVSDGIAYNETDAATDLIYGTIGCTFSFGETFSKLVISPCVGAYWKHSDTPIWDIKLDQPGLIADEQRVNAENAFILSERPSPLLKASDYSYRALQGWQTTKFANKFLGMEVSCLASYQVTENVDIALKVGIFMPGQFYKDIEGTPNSNTQRKGERIASNGTFNAVAENPGLGYNAAYGANLRIGYTF